MFGDIFCGYMVRWGCGIRGREGLHPILGYYALSGLGAARARDRGGMKAVPGACPRTRRRPGGATAGRWGKQRPRDGVKSRFFTIYVIKI